MTAPTGPFTWTQQRGLLVNLREMATRVFARARRPMMIEIAFLRVGPTDRGRRIAAVEPPDTSLSAETFEALAIDPARPWPEALRAAVQERLDERDHEERFRSFAGGSARVGDVDVVPILRFDAAVFDSQPSLSDRLAPDGSSRCRSLLEGIAWTLLTEATRGLRGTAGGEPSYDHLSRDPEDVLRTAGRWLTVTAGRAGGPPQGLIGLFDEINEIASLRYEGREPMGRMVIARPDHPSVDEELGLKHPVPLEEAVWARKMLEMASVESCLLTDSLCIHGLGRVSDDYNASREDLFVIDFGGHQRWELRHANTMLMRVAYGIPALHDDPLDADAFRAELRSEFGELPETAAACIWSVVHRALAQKYGALIVVAERAEQESMRLANQGVPIEPTLLTEEAVDRVTSIDGAVLLDTKGLCHAVGVILDGRARSEVGSPARGARYNSAARYVDAAQKPALVVVASEDGTVDVIRRTSLPVVKQRAA